MLELGLVKIKNTIKVLALGAKIFPRRRGGAGSPNVNWGSPIIPETTKARKLKLKIQLDAGM